ncbi:DNA-binding protein [Aliivibrio salmonicida]|uniref:DNA-binding protein n=1 Tax=Aliivibrio salmonicida TaxID=40269 RepID=UPI0013ECD1ED|nr:DNA-binding protein [Aliivibrio salmonicida]
MTLSSELKSRIWNIADKLSSEGVNPTNKVVLNKLGSGSYSSIAPILKEWREKKHAINVDEIPNELMQATKHVWEKVSELSAANYIKSVKALEDEVINLTVELEVNSQKSQMQSQKINELNEALAEANERNVLYENKVEDNSLKYAADLKELNKSIKSATDQTVNERILCTEFKTKLNITEKSLAETKHQVSLLEQLLNEEKKQKYEAEKQRDLKQSALDSADVLAKKQEGKISSLNQAEVDLKASLLSEKLKCEHNISLVSDLNTTVLEAEKEIDKIKLQMDASTLELASLTEIANGLVSSNKSLSTENHDIQIQYDNLLLVCNSLFDVDVIKKFAINNKTKKEILLALSNQTNNKTNK